MKCHYWGNFAKKQQALQWILRCCSSSQSLVDTAVSASHFSDWLKDLNVQKSRTIYILRVTISLYTIWIKNNNQSFTVIYFLVFRCSDDSLGFLPRFLHFPVIYDLINYLKTIGVKEYLFQKKIFPDLFV